MTVRLAFAVATATRPEILIVDEALAVGDAYFQHKCVQRIKEFQAAGTTLLFVSHDPVAVRTLCRRALLLDAGRLIQDGPADSCSNYYNALIAKRRRVARSCRPRRRAGASPPARAPSSPHREVELLDAAGQPARAFSVGDWGRIRTGSGSPRRWPRPRWGS